MYMGSNCVTSLEVRVFKYCIHVSRKDRRIFSTPIPILKLGVRRSFQVTTELHSGYNTCIFGQVQVHVVGGTDQGVAQLQQEFFSQNLRPKSPSFWGSIPFCGLRLGNQRCGLDTNGYCPILTLAIL